MMKAVLLIGSPRGERSTSGSLGLYLLDLLRKKGWNIEDLQVNRSLGSLEGIGALVSAVDTADLVILSFPTYVDATPAAMVRAMELLVQQRRGNTDRTPLMAIANCGFMEAEQNRSALDICRLFARDGGFEWRGGLALGGGPAIDGRPLAELGGMARNVRRSLALSAEALAEGKELPKVAIDLMAKRSLPRWLYIAFGNLGWKRRAKKNGAQDRMYDRPFTEGKREE
jgi:hypothetical protein